jgi:hypothetical protein
MSTNTWNQYVAMDDGLPQPGTLDAALEGLEDWEDDLDLGDLSLDASADLDDGFDD